MKGYATREYSYVKKALLRALSEDSRTSITDLAKAAGCSRNTALTNVKAMEGEFGLHYTIDFNKERLGFSQRHIIRIKLGKKPKVSELKNIFEKDELTSLVAVMRGDFDLLVYAESNSGPQYMRWETSLAMKLIEYKPVLRPSQIVLTHIGFMPLNDATLETLDLASFGLDGSDKKILEILNMNSRTSYSEIAKTLGMNDDTVRYRFRRITRSGIVQRFTLVAERPPTDYNMAFFVNYHFAPGIERRSAKAREHYMNIDGKMPLVNRFQFLSPISGSYRFFGIACFDEEKDAVANAIEAHRKIFAGDKPAISHAKVESVLKGHLPIRNIDVRKEYKVVRWEEP